jgi:hypothetical protein
MSNISYILLFLFCFSGVVYAGDIMQAQENTRNSIKMNEFILKGASQDHGLFQRYVYRYQTARDAGGSERCLRSAGKSQI